MLVQRVWRPLGSLRHIQRCYSTISTQSTVSYGAQGLPQQKLRIQTPVKTDSHIDKKTDKVDIPNVHDQYDNLLKAKQMFQNVDGVFNKIELLNGLLQNSNETQPLIRIGLIGSKPSFLNTLLSDPFASDQSWYENLLSRPQSTLIKYNDELEIDETSYGIPSPYLKTKSIEFIEFQDLSTHDYDNDGCHLYLNFGPPGHYIWPVFEFQDIDSDSLSYNEINSKLALEAINLLKESPLNASEYTNLYNQSQFVKFHSTLDKLIQPGFIIDKLYKSIIKNFQTQNIKNSLTLEELTLKDTRIKSFIKSWDESTHREFQLVFKPYITKFELDNLSWWKLYYKNDDVETILTTMLNQGFLNDSLKRYSYVKGQIDSFSSLKNVELDTISSELDDNSLTILKNQIIEHELIPIQNQCIKLLALNFVGLQLPMGLVSLAGYWFYGFEPYSMISLGSLGLVLGFNNVSKNWLKIISKFKKNLFEQTRLSISQTNQQLYQNWERKYNLEKTQILTRIGLLNKLQK